MNVNTDPSINLTLQQNVCARNGCDKVLTCLVGCNIK